MGSVAWQNQKRQAHDAAYGQCLNSNTRTYSLAPQPSYYVPEPVYAPSYRTYGPFNAVIEGASAVNLRNGPGARYAVVGQVYAQQAVSIRSCDGTWCQVELEGGGVAYASQSYVHPISG